MKKKAILITGGAGFIGSNIAERIQNDYRVIVLDNLSTGKQENLEGLRCSFRKGDCRNVLELVPEKVDCIFHLGMASSTTLYLNDKELIGSQVIGTLKVFEKAIKDKAKIVIASSSSLYNKGELPSKEDQIIKVSDFYTECRLMIERLAQLYSELYEMKVVCLRMFSVYGGKREIGKKNFMNMLTKFLLAVKQDKSPVSFGDGTQERDFIYIDDIIDGWLLAKDYNKKDFNIFNLGSGKKYNFNQVLEVINQTFGTNIRMEYEENPLKNFVFQTFADTQKAESELKFKAKISLEEGIKKVYDYIKTI